MEGQLSRHPPAELIREIIDSELSGALRLSRDAARIAAYFDAGKIIFAASNLRGHRLREILKRDGLAAAQLEFLPATTKDEDLAQALISSGELTADDLQKARVNQVSDVLRVALLWTDGSWQFDGRVRVPSELQVVITLERLLLESARHLPVAFVKSRLADPNAGYSLGQNGSSSNLTPAESFVLARAREAGSAFRLSDLAANGMSEEDQLRSVYALSLSGILNRTDWQYALNLSDPKKPKPKRPPEPPRRKETTAPNIDQFLARMKTAADHYAVLEVSRAAGTDEIKDAYHRFARQYHPDLFHQRDAALRSQISSAFARVAQAYEVLSDSTTRANYDKAPDGRPAAPAKAPEAKKTSPAPAPSRAANPVTNPVTNPAANPAANKEQGRAELSFKRGLEAMKTNEFDRAIPLLAEAATLEPRQARYRAHYGHALMNRPNNRRLAETELQAAVALEPKNPAFRVMLAELYQRVGLRKRAEGEVSRALACDPNNQAARALLSSMKSK
jgi:curved DNA-binding protein CbpA